MDPLQTGAEAGARRGAALPTWAPNAITLVRLVLIPLFLASAWATQSAARTGGAVEEPRILALSLLAVIAASDFVDGYLARRYGVATQLGSALDAGADWLTQLSSLGFFALTHGPAFPSVPVWLPALLLARNVVVAGGWMVARRRDPNVRMQHRMHGKVATAVGFALLLAVTAGLSDSVVRPLIWLVAASATYSFVAYGLEGWRILRQAARVP
ncbi:MAG: CDP-alcohol phosphatidyltransferase family protein [Gemmatimonadetes bacterium]|nr:CDP-alcohol phosphatidyltransferase family protein [Gemmatimonadota bacterium]